MKILWKYVQIPLLGIRIGQLKFEKTKKNVYAARLYKQISSAQVPKIFAIQQLTRHLARTSKQKWVNAFAGRQAASL